VNIEVDHGGRTISDGDTEVDHRRSTCVDRDTGADHGRAHVETVCN
jgi:hypothetical protein